MRILFCIMMIVVLVCGNIVLAESHQHEEQTYWIELHPSVVFQEDSSTIFGYLIEEEMNEKYSLIDTGVVFRETDEANVYLLEISIWTVENTESNQDYGLSGWNVYFQSDSMVSLSVLSSNPRKDSAKRDVVFCNTDKTLVPFLTKLICIPVYNGIEKAENKVVLIVEEEK